MREVSRFFLCQPGILARGHEDRGSMRWIKRFITMLGLADIETRRLLILPLAFSHGALLIIDMLDRAQFSRPPLDITVQDLFRTPVFAFSHFAAAVLLFAAASVCTALPWLAYVALATSTGVMLGTAGILFWWAFSVPEVAVSLVGPVMCLGMGAVAFALCVTWPDEADTEQRR